MWQGGLGGLRAAVIKRERERLELEVMHEQILLLRRLRAEADARLSGAQAMDAAPEQKSETHD